MRMQYELASDVDSSQAYSGRPLPNTGKVVTSNEAFAYMGTYLNKTIRGVSAGFDSCSVEFTDGTTITFIANPGPPRVVLHIRDHGTAGDDDRWFDR